MTAIIDRKPICSALLRVIFLLAKMYVESWEMLAAARMTASIRKPLFCQSLCTDVRDEDPSRPSASLPFRFIGTVPV